MTSIKSEEVGKVLQFAESSAKVADLRFQHIKKLGKLLDTSQIPNWRTLGKKIFEYDAENEERIDFMCHHYTEQNAPSSKFIHSLEMRNPYVTISIFKDVADRLNRKDISLYLNSLSHLVSQSIFILSMKTQLIITTSSTIFARGQNHDDHDLDLPR